VTRYEITTGRLGLRPYRESDLDALAAFHAHPETMRFFGAGRTVGREATVDHIARQMAIFEQQGYGMMVAEIVATGEVIGRCGYLHWDIDGSDELEIGWLIGARHRGRGYATEAGIATRDHGFDVIGRRRLISVIQPGNLASVRVAEKVGETFWKPWVTPSGHEVHLFAVERAGAYKSYGPIVPSAPDPGGPSASAKHP